MYTAFLTVLVFIMGLISYFSGTAELSADVRINLSPRDIEQIHQELQGRRQWGIFLMLLSLFPVMIHLCLFF